MWHGNTYKHKLVQHIVIADTYYYIASYNSLTEKVSGQHNFELFLGLVSRSFLPAIFVKHLNTANVFGHLSFDGYNWSCHHHRLHDNSDIKTTCNKTYNFIYEPHAEKEMQWTATFPLLLYNPLYSLLHNLVYYMIKV